MSVLCDFIRTGLLGVIELGVQYREVVNRLGEPDGFASDDPVFCLYGDLQLGFSHSGKLWHVAIESDSGEIESPDGLGADPRELLPGFPEVLEFLACSGESFAKCEPFTEGEIWYRVDRSGVLLREGERGSIAALHLSSLEILGFAGKGNA